MKAEKLIRSVIYMLTSSGLELAISIAITIALAKFLNPLELGLIMAAEAFVELFNFIFRGGFRNSILKFAAQDNRSFQEGLNSSATSALIIKAVTLIPLGFVINFISIKTQNDNAILNVILAYIALNSLDSISSVFGIVRKALGQFKLMSFIIAFNRILRLAVIFFVLVYLHGDLNMLLIAFLIEKLITTIVSALSTFKFMKLEYNPSQIIPMFKESFHYGFLDSLEDVQSRIDRVMINSAMGAEAVAFYSIPAKLNRTTKITLKAFTQVFLPILHENIIKDQESFKNITKHLSRFLALFGIIIFIGIFYYAQEILYFLFGDKYAESVHIVKYFGFINLFWFLEQTSELILMSQGTHTNRFVTLVSPVVLNIALNLVLIPRYGIEGALYAAMLTNFIKLSLFIRYTHRYIELAKCSAIVILPLLLVFFLPIYYLGILYFAYIVIAKLVTKEDLDIVIRALKLKSAK